MSVMKRLTAHVGKSRPQASGGMKLGDVDSWICPHCHCHSRLVREEGEMVCLLCSRSPKE